ncbi:hypothetical protein FISHEDRAFT_64502 [Fistulina hepatica ATCC 64428]|nr:hypothetical protein FISHEDRAFT_64502 [Fistulina hepatica ATCC 64428]
MAIRTGIIVCVTGFLLGAFFTNWIADSRTLWKSPVTDENIWLAASYYAIIAQCPSVALYFLCTVILAGGLTLLWSFGDGEAGNLMFDGGSLFLYGTTAVMYAYYLLPGILAKQVSQPIRETVLALASNNLICSVALTGVLLLQGARIWVDKTNRGIIRDSVILADGTKAKVD